MTLSSSLLLYNLHIERNNHYILQLHGDMVVRWVHSYMPKDNIIINIMGCQSSTKAPKDHQSLL